MVRPRHIEQTRLDAQESRQHPGSQRNIHALTDRALVAAVAWKYIAYNQPATSSHPNATGLASTRAELASLNELILTGSGGNGARSPLLDHYESAARLR
jgi:hypothetical protein